MDHIEISTLTVATSDDGVRKRKELGPWTKWEQKAYFGGKVGPHCRKTVGRG